MYKKQKLNGNELAMLSQAFSKNLFLRPTKGDIQSVCYPLDGCSLYFELGYYKRLMIDIEESYNNGEFAISNSNDLWIDLMEILKKSENIDEVEKGYVKDYYEAIGKHWS